MEGLNKVLGVIPYDKRKNWSKQPSNENSSKKTHILVHILNCVGDMQRSFLTNG